MEWIDQLDKLNRINKGTEELWVSGQKIKELTFLKDFRNLKKLFLRSFKTTNLSPLKSLKELKHLELTNVGNGGNLEAISHLTSLQELIIQTPPGWDGGSKRLSYDSLAPLRNLENLVSLTLLDVLFTNDELTPLTHLKSLDQLDTRNTFTIAAFVELSISQPKLKCRYTKPYTIWEGVEYYRCKKCGSMKVEFSGIDLKRRVFCLNCNKKKTDELVVRFNEIKAEKSA